MTRQEILNKLSTITIIVANPTVTYDMGMQFDVMTGQGATTTFGNVGQWPFMRFVITESFRDLQKSLLEGYDVSGEIMLQDPICKELCKYHDMWNGSYSLEGESLSKCLSCIKEKIQSVDLSGNELFVYAEVEEWDIDIRFFPDYLEFQKAMLADWEGSVDDYEGMDDSELEGWYEVAEANDWDGIPYASFGETIDGHQ